MRLLGELTDTMKPLPSMDGQLTLIMSNQAEEQKTSAFIFSQEIIDAVLTRGSGVSEGKMRIYEQFEKSLSAKENADFLKNEYGWGGSYPVIIGAGIDEQHDGKGITISKGIGSDKPHITLSWSQVEKRIGDLIRMDRYLNPKEKEKYPEWLEKQEERRAELAEQRKNREILSTAPPEPENKEDETEAQYEYHLGDSVYIGASQYEILSFDENRVMLYDFDMPLFNKELPREEFDRKVRENPMNNHLKVSVLPAEEKAVTGENEAQNDTKTVQDFSPKTGYDDAFYIDRDNESVTWMYYNPDSNAGGQYVTNTLSFDEIQQAALEYDSAEDFFDYLGSIANQELADVGTEWFVDADREFHRTPDLTDCTTATMEALIENAERTDMVATNIGNVPIEDYREIVATQNGFDSYEEMYNEGVRIGNGYDKKPEPIVPAWEQKKKSKVKSFDLHPDIPMSERHNFDLANNQVEEVNKKERFHRNYAAIKVLKDCQNENRFATPDEQKILSRYVGWGGIPEAFDERAGAWHTEYAMLKNNLTPEEYVSARESTLTAFYTPPEVSTAIYKVLEQMGFQEGNLLEPSCGIGNFIGMLPKSMENAKVYGVELDTVSAGIAQQLYQKSSIAAQGFEEVNVPDSFFDGVIGNVPFGDFKVSDKRYDKYNFLIHDYFFAKSLDKLRPGGVMALVTSKGTMDKENSNVRKYIAQRAELLGAIRLPNDTFKGNAGTEVVSDILFLQKRDRLIDIEPDWVHLDTDENGIRMNSYFVRHPEMILGEMKMVSGRFGPEATCEPFENADLSELLNEAVSNIHGEISEYEVADELEEEDNSIPADPTVRNFSYTVLDDKIYFRENSRMSPVEVSATAENRIKGMIGIRDCVRNLIELQTEDYPDSEIKQAQEKLNTLYDSFTKKYGLINSRANTSAFSDDSSYALLSALEVINEDGELERKADMFFKRTIKPHKPVTEVDTADEALAVSMGEKATIDMEYMMELSGKSEEELFADLKGVIFLNPLYEYGNSYEPKYLMADEYLSGNVREKLATAKRSATLYPEDYTVNVQALEKVQPKDLTASEISVRLGATWIPPEIFQQFMFEFLDTPRYAQWNIKVHYSQFTGEWNIEGKSYDRSNVKAYSTYGTSRINAYKIIEETLNLKDVRIFDYIEDDEGKKKAVLNKKETAIAQAKQELIKQGFQDWIWADPARREKLTKMYNEKFNSIRPREYDGSHIVFNGMNPEIELREHQKNAVAHILYGGNTLLAHAVGAGKTFEMVAAAMESKRLGLCNKSLFVVPNHLTEQWAAEFLQLYPAANILVATKRDFETKNRKKFCGRIATGDYDAVIIGHSQFEKIPMSIERQRAILEQQLEELTDGIMDLKRNRGENFSIKQLEKSKKSVKQKLEKLNDQSRKDDVVTFEELGVDRLFIDESHYYKNLYLYTKMRNVGGIAQTEAQKSSDLFMKCRYLDELTGGRGTVFATGTPISNSMVELYTIQRYLQYNTLVKNNLQHFDSWASTFGETVTAVELTPEGTGYRAKTRFAKFYNLPELMAMFKEVADIKTADMLELPVPEAHFHNVAVKPSEMQKEMVASLAERAEKVRGGGVDSSVDNMLKITNDGRKLALDQRMLNDMLPDFEGSKINACVDNIYRIWEETADKKSAQLVFCDLSTPKNDGTFSVYNDIRKKLIERGVPESEVRFIHEADTDVKKKELFQKTRKGEVRVLLGSTQKMGAGTNVQDRLIALHDVDCPWRPSDLEQRSGRIIRQGNSNPDVDIYRYVTEQTFDAYLYQLVEGKQKFASQIMTSKSPVRSAEDIDETALSYAEIKMLATGNPYIKEKMDLDIQVQKLKLLKSNFLSEKYALEDKIIKYYPQRITALENRIEGLKQDVDTAKQHPKPTDDRFVGMEVKGVFYSEKADAGKAIINACKQMNSPDPIPLGKYRGFETELLFNTAERNYEVRLKGATSRNVPLGDDAHGNIIRLDNGIDRFAESLSLAENDLENTKNQLETAKKEVQKPFIQEEELKTKLARLDELNILLNMDKRDNEIVGGEPDEGEVPNTRKEKTYER
ncbi:N-6 DNA methylase [Enterocloster clostridioformis]|nr:N-6 DNA methylase [Enterocloster clostridioformis]